MRTRRTTYLTALIAATCLSLGLTGCGDDADTDKTAGEVSASADHNQADIDFATEMIPHHAQALLMVDMTQGRKLTPEFSQLTEAIRDAQTPEIELMVDWLEDWDQPVPRTDRDHMAMGHDGGDGMGMGMMSEEDFDRLMNSKRARFEAMWLTMMIEHHEGAIEMAEIEIDEGKFPDAISLAEQIAGSQAEEIALMERMLG